MRILYLADIRFPLERANGVQSMETCHALARRGHYVTLAVRPDTEHPPRDPYRFYGLPRIGTLTIEIVPLAGPATARRVGYLTYAFGRSAGRARQDVVVTRDLGVASIVLRLPAALRAPVVYEAHTIAADAAAARPALLAHAQPPSAAKLARLTSREQRVWGAADGYITITHGLAEALASRFGRRPRLAVVPDGVRMHEIAETSAAEGTDTTDRAGTGPARPFIVGYAGHLYPWKGVETVIEVVRAMPEVCARIVGGHPKEPDLERLTSVAADLDCAGRVTFTGPVPPGAVADELRRADVLLLPNPSSAISDAFTSPLKLFEYMASGRPIVASDLPSIREVLTHEQNALLADPGNPAAFVAAVTRLQREPELAGRLAAQARIDVADYTWDRRAERLEALLRDLVPGR